MSNGADIAAAVALAAVVGATLFVLPHVKRDPPPATAETSDAERVEAVQKQLREIAAEQRRLTSQVATIAADAKGARDQEPTERKRK